MIHYTIKWKINNTKDLTSAFYSSVASLFADKCGLYAAEMPHVPLGVADIHSLDVHKHMSSGILHKC